MKKILIFVLALLSIFCFASCKDTSSIICPTCGYENVSNAKFCQSCGKSVSPSNNEDDNIETQKPHEHNFKSTITEPTCTTAGYTTYACECGATYKDDYKNAMGHKWNEATCITPKMCPVCKATEGEPEGHTFEDGECIYCYEDDPDYIALTLTSDKYNIILEENSDIVYITMIGGETVTYDITDTSVVRCEWGEWDGDVISLTFTPISNGNTVVTVYIKGYDKSIEINVSVEMPETTLTIDELGKEYKYYPTYGSLAYNVNVVNSATYTVDTGHLDYDGTVTITVDLIVSMTEYNTSYGYINIDYELYNEAGVCIETGYVWVDFKYIGRSYAYSITFFDLKPGDYTLRFYDTYQ